MRSSSRITTSGGAGGGAVGGGSGGAGGGTVDAGKVDAGLPWLPCLGATYLTLDAGAGGLSASDRTALINALDVIAYNWVQTSVDQANAVLMSGPYSAAAYEAFFTEYFVTLGRPWTNGIRNYIGYPVFFWAPAPQRTLLQEGLTRAAWKKLDGLATALGNNVGPALAADSGIRETLFSVGAFFTAFESSLSLIAPQMRGYWVARLAELVAAHPTILGASPTFSGTTQPYLAAYRAQTWMALADVRPLDACAANGIASTLGLTGTRATLMTKNGVLLHDNNALPQSTLTAISSLVDAFPTPLVVFGHVVQADSLNNVAPTNVGFGSRGEVGITNVAPGTQLENPFPAEVAAVSTDTWLEGLLYSAHFSIQRELIDANPVRASRRDALIARAGTTDKQFLRSMTGAAFFQSYPSTLIPSTSLQYWTDSARTLDVALVRFDAGFKEPINQFLFMADLYSVDGGVVPAYRMWPDASVDRAAWPVIRNAAGHITTLTTDGGKFVFTIDDGGFVTSWTRQ